MTRSLIQALVAIALAAAGTSQATTQKPEIKQLPRVVVTGKSLQSQQIAQLPRVVIEGRSLERQLAERTALAAAASTGKRI